MLTSILLWLLAHADTVVLAVFGFIGAFVLRHVARWTILATAAREVGAAVLATYQTFSQELKERSTDGKLTASEARDALALAKARFVESVGPGFLRVLDAAVGGQLERWLGTQMEAAVAATKPLVVPPRPPQAAPSKTG
jgi:hypothetical protein